MAFLGHRKLGLKLRLAMVIVGLGIRLSLGEILVYSVSVLKNSLNVF
jgi:hypothetical protein